MIYKQKDEPGWSFLVTPALGFSFAYNESVSNQTFTSPQECTGQLCEGLQSNPSRTSARPIKNSVNSCTGLSFLGAAIPAMAGPIFANFETLLDVSHII